MSLTINQEPTSPCFTKNMIRYKVTSTEQYPVKARLYVEMVPQSDSYTYITELRDFPDAAGVCFFDFTNIFEEDILTYTKPDFFGVDTLQPTICKRFKVSFFEAHPTRLTLTQELYHEDSDANTLSWVDITELTNNTDHIFIAETTTDLNPIIRSGATEITVTDLYDLGDEQWYCYFVATTGNDEIKIPGYTKVSIYEGPPYVIVTSDISFSLLGGSDRDSEYMRDRLPIPTAFAAVAISDTEIDLSWAYSSEKHTSFTVEQSADGGTTWTQSTSVSSLARTLSRTGLTADTTYTYRIRSFNATQVSEWSELVSETTYALVTSFGTQVTSFGTNVTTI